MKGAGRAAHGTGARLPNRSHPRRAAIGAGAVQEQTIRVLLVEDNPDDADLLLEMMRDGVSAHLQLVHAARLDEALQHLEEEEFALILLDLGLPDSRGIGTLERVRDLAPDQPAVVLTGLDDSDLAMEAVRDGAQDYLVKGQVDGRLLSHAMRYAIERNSARQALRLSSMELERDIRTAQKIQEALLPRRLPASSEAERVALWAKCVPARRVGGDLYEFFFRNDTTLTLVMGDVAGSGVPAALLMTMVCALARTLAIEEDSPAPALKRTSEALLQVIEPSSFVTMFMAFYETRSRALTFANAGHGPPIIVRPDGTKLLLESTGTVLGMFEEMEATNESIQLHPGDRLIAYSDGITDAPDPDGKRFGLARLEQMIADAACVDLQSVVENLLNSVHAHQAGGPQFDDMTVLAFEVKG